MYCDLTRFKAEMTKRYLSKLRKTISRHVLVSIVLVFCFQTMSFAEVTQAEVEKLGKTIVTLSNGKTIAYQELVKLNHAEQDKIIEVMSEAQVESYTSYLDVLGKASNQRIVEMDKHHEAQLARIAEMNKQLVDGYTRYFAQIERTKVASKEILNNIIGSDDFLSLDMREKAKAYLNDKSIKFED